MPVILRAAMKPIPTLRKPLRSVHIITKKSVEAAYERSDICAVPAAAVIGEAMVALTLASAFLEKFGSDSMDEVKSNYQSYMKYIRISDMTSEEPDSSITPDLRPYYFHDICFLLCPAEIFQRRHPDKPSSTIKKSDRTFIFAGCCRACRRSHEVGGIRG